MLSHFNDQKYGTYLITILCRLREQTGTLSNDYSPPFKPRPLFYLRKVLATVHVIKQALEPITK